MLLNVSINCLYLKADQSFDVIYLFGYNLNERLGIW